MSLKRVFDIAGSAAGLAIASPIMLAVGLTTIFKDRAQPFYTQTRIGHNGTQFTIYKFRTIKNEYSDRDGTDYQQGHFEDFLRRYKLDELPQFYNVLKGDMSLVGPRPTSELIDPLYAFDQKRNTVKPGLTCLYQISRNKDVTSIDEILSYDHAYVDLVQSLSPWMLMMIDIKILLSTPLAIFSQRNLSCKGVRIKASQNNQECSI